MCCLFRQYSCPAAFQLPNCSHCLSVGTFVLFAIKNAFRHTLSGFAGTLACNFSTRAYTGDVIRPTYVSCLTVLLLCAGSFAFPTTCIQSGLQCSWTQSFELHTKHCNYVVSHCSLLAKLETEMTSTRRGANET